jgi:hypothetical protein
MIAGTNSIINQFVPNFVVNAPINGQVLAYDSTRKSFVNTNSPSNITSNKLGELLNVSNNVDNTSLSHNGQALVYNSLSTLWENTFIDYSTLLNKPNIPVNSDFSFAGLSDTAKPPLPNGYVKWDSSGSQMVYSTTIPASSITGLSNGSVTSVTVSGQSGRITSSGGAITTAGTITLDLGITGIGAGTYGDPSSALTLGVDVYGRIITISSAPIALSETVVLQYSAGVSGDFSTGDNIYSTTTGVTAVISNGPACEVSYYFTRNTLPKSIITYGQIFSSNDFVIRAPVDTISSTKVNGGGTNTNPDIIHNTFTTSNIIKITHSTLATGAIGEVGSRAFLVVIFNF